MKIKNGVIVAFASVFFAASLVPEAHATAQLWTDNCSGCHGAMPSGARANAANSLAIIDAAIENVPAMAGLALMSPLDRNSIATYIGQQIPTSPVATSTLYNTPVNISLVLDVYLGTAATTLDTLENVTAPISGTATYDSSSATEGVTYSPGTGTNAGTIESFSYRARDSTTGLVTSTRTINVTINKANQIVTFGAQPTRTFVDADFLISPLATTNAIGGAAITYSSLTIGQCFVTGTTVTLVASGTCTLRATAASVTNYFSATADSSFTVNPGTPTMTFGAQGTRTFGAAPFAINPVATTNASGSDISYTSLTTGVCTVSGTTVTLVGGGTCTLRATGSATPGYNSAFIDSSFTVNPTSPTMTFGWQSTRTFGAAPFPISPLATTNATGSTITYSSLSPFGCTVSGTTVTLVANGFCGLRATGSATASYHSGFVDTEFWVDPGTPTMTFGAQPTRTLGEAPFAIDPLATTNAGSAITYSSLTAGVCTVSGTTVTLVGGGTCTLRATHPQTAQYLSGFIDSSFTVNLVTPTVTFGAQAPRTFGEAPFSISPLATTNATGSTITYSSLTTGVCTVSGTTVTVVGGGTCTLRATGSATTNYASGTADSSFSINPATPVTTFGTQATQIYAPGGTFAINPLATTNAPGATITYTSQAPGCSVSGTTVTIVAAGTCTLRATGTATSNYNMSFTETSFAISQASQVITFGTQSPASRAFSSGATFPINPLATSNAAGNAINYVSLSTGVCSVSGTTVTMNVAGICTLGANAAATLNYNAAMQVEQTIAITAAATTGPRSGFNGDLFSDVLWRDSTGGLVYQWQMNGLSIIGQGYLPSVPSNWTPVALGDVNADGKADVFWREAGGVNYLWMVDGLGIVNQGYLPSVPVPWVVTGMGDLNGDGKWDVVWRNPTTGENYLWLMDGLSITGQGYLPAVGGTDWEMAGIADYSGDGKADVMWRNKATGENYLWVMNGLVIASQGFMPAVPAGWDIVASPNADGNATADIFWRNAMTGENYVWLLNGLTVTGQGYLPAVSDIAWKVVGFGDYSGDGKGDILWRHATGTMYLWTLDSLTVTSQGYLPNVVGTNWQPVK